jgi:hypothetical protein
MRFRDNLTRTIVATTGDPRSRVVGRFRLATIGAGIATLVILPFCFASARDRGQFASSGPEIRAWFDGLRSGRGPCCSDADGTAVSDVDWESKGGHFRVHLESAWIDVPDEAVITESNRVGRTMVWPYHGSQGLMIRCFMPGSMI